MNELNTQNRVIRVNSCDSCPKNGKCSAWEALTKKQKVYLSLSNAVPVDFMLASCPLEVDSQPSPTEPLAKTI